MLDPAVTIEGVLFDIDDTLVDTHGAFAEALALVARKYLPRLGPERYAELLGAWRADVGGHYRRYTSGEIGYHDQRMARANALHSEFGGTVLDAEEYQAWNEVFEAGFAASWAAHPEALQVVDALIGAGLAVGALSNAAVAYQRTKLHHAGLGDRVEVLVGVDTLGVGKPDPRVFHEACRRLGPPPERTAYVGDELDIDARAAVAAGLVGVWVNRPGLRAVDPADVAAAREAGVLVLESLAGLPGLLVPRARSTGST